MRFNIALLGFAEYEEGLFIQQLKTVRKHTDIMWCHQADISQCDYVIEHDLDSKQAVIYKKDHQSFKTHLEWPVRLFGLLDALKIYEEHDVVQSVSCKENVSFMQFLKHITQTTVGCYFNEHGFKFLFDADTAVVYSNAGCFNQLVSHLLSADTISQLYFYTHDSDAVEIKQQCSLVVSKKKLIWALLTAYKKVIHTDLELPNCQFKLKTWPIAADYSSTPGMLRLAAIFTRQYTTVKQAAEFAKVLEIDVIAFLQACQTTGIQLETERVSAINKGAQVSAVSEVLEYKVSGFVARLRTKLGIAFSR